mmetsp:Transcript_3289/g.10857  ORF Transcript_3289/g.10857 Transcript_3289/m.10857 type:complete len:313 (-) Transcript_3289:1511-2449(-)
MGHRAPLGDPRGAHFHGLGPLHHVGGGVGDGARPQVLQHVPRLQPPKLRVGVLEVPHQRRLPLLNEGPRGALAEVLKHLLHGLLPLRAQALACSLPHARVGVAHEDTVLRRQPHPQVPEHILEPLLHAAREDAHRRVGVRRERPEHLQYRGRHPAQALVVVVLPLGPPRRVVHGQRRVEPQHDEAVLGAAVHVHHVVAPEGLRDLGGPQLRLHVRVIELAHEGVGPRLRGVNGDVHEVLPMPLPPLRVRHRERVLDGAREVVDIPRVDQHRPRPETLRRARELAKDEHARVVALARHVLVAHQVHPVPQRGH